MNAIKAYFISDLHLGAKDDRDEHIKQQRFLEFLKRILGDATHFYIVGDLFDFWFEYKYVIPKHYFAFLHEFKRLSDQGVEMHYLAGNHDFALNSFFRDVLGIQTWLNEYEFELGARKFYLFHGDGIAKNDIGYRFLKRILRSKINQHIFKAIHPDVGIALAHLASGSSRKYTNQMNQLRDEGDYKEFAERQFARGIDYVIMGHRHNPLVHEVQGKKYINLGDWIENFTYAVFDGSEISLRYFLEEPDF